MPTQGLWESFCLLWLIFRELREEHFFLCVLFFVLLCKQFTQNCTTVHYFSHTFLLCIVPGKKNTPDLKTRVSSIHFFRCKKNVILDIFLSITIMRNK